MHAFGAEIATRHFTIYFTLLFSGCFVHPLHYFLANLYAESSTIATRDFAIYIPLYPFGVLGRGFLHLQCAILHVEVHFGRNAWFWSHNSHTRFDVCMSFCTSS